VSVAASAWRNTFSSSQLSAKEKAMSKKLDGMIPGYNITPDVIINKHRFE